MQSIRMRAVAMSPYMSGLIVCDMKFRYIILLIGEKSQPWPGRNSFSVTVM
jgi:hypothetical protein